MIDAPLHYPHCRINRGPLGSCDCGEEERRELRSRGGKMTTMSDGSPQASWLTLHPKNGTLRVEVNAHDDGTVTVGFGTDYTLSRLTHEGALELSQAIAQHAGLAEKALCSVALWKDVTNDQLAWYVANCMVDAYKHDPVELVSCLLLGCHSLRERSRDQLISDACSHNEDERNTARRLKESLKNCPDGWVSFEEARKMISWR